MFIDKYIDWLEDNALALFAFVSLWFLVSFAWPLAQLGTFHLRVVEAFNTDEGEFLWPVSQAFARGDINIGRYDYGLMYYNIGLFSAYFVDLFIEMTDQRMIQLFRMESFFFVLLTALVLYDYGKRYVSTFFGISMFMMSLLGSQTMLVYGLMLHPDTCQVFFIVLCVYALARFVEQAGWKWALISSAAAGFAFSSKYAGLALLPLIFSVLIAKGQQLFAQLSNKKIVLLLSILTALWALLLDVSWIEPYITQKAEIVVSLYRLIDVVQGLCFLVVLLAVLSWQVKRIREIKLVKMINQSMLILVSSVSVFMLAFVFSSPQAAYKFNFLNGFIYVTNLHKDGHWFRDDSGLVGWFNLLSQYDVLGMIWLLLAAFSIVYLSYRIKRIDGFSPRLLPFYWVVIFLLVVVLRVKSKFAHYLIPIIPFVIFYAVLAIHFLVYEIFVVKKVVKRILSYSLLVLASGFLSVRAYEYKSMQEYEHEHSDTMTAGFWLEKVIQEEVFILADKYCYIPAIAQIKHTTVFGLTLDQIEHWQPDVLVINKRIYEHFLDLEDKESYLHGKDVFVERHVIYTSLLKDDFEGYHLVKDFGDVKVFFKD